MAGRFELRVLQQCTRQEPRVPGAATLEKTIGEDTREACRPRRVGNQFTDCCIHLCAHLVNVHRGTTIWNSWLGLLRSFVWE